MTKDFIKSCFVLRKEYTESVHNTLFYCDVFTDENHTEVIDFFYIHPDDLHLTKQLSEYTEKDVFNMAEEFATDMAETILEDYYRNEAEDANEVETVYLSFTGHKKDIQDLLDYANKLPLVIRKE